MRDNRVVHVNENEAYQFASEWLPWIAKKTGLRYEWNWLVPQMEELSQEELNNRYNDGYPSGSACYLPLQTKLVYCGSEHDKVRIEGTLIHELVHFLQDKNGMFRAQHKRDINITEIERMAYATMRDWWIEERNIPDAYGLTKPEIFAKAIGMSVGSSK